MRLIAVFNANNCGYYTIRYSQYYLIIAVTSTRNATLSMIDTVGLRVLVTLTKATSSIRPLGLPRCRKHEKCFYLLYWLSL